MQFVLFTICIWRVDKWPAVARGALENRSQTGIISNARMFMQFWLGYKSFLQGVASTINDFIYTALQPCLLYTSDAADE